MRNIDPPTDAELAAYTTGDLSPSRLGDIASWIAADDANAARVETVRQLLTTPTTTQAWDRDRIFSGVTSRLARAESGASLLMNGRSWTVAKVAAAVIIVVGAGFLYTRHVVPWAQSTTPTETPEHVYATHRGERATVQLSDGSRVTLAPESRLRVSAGFGTGQRAVALEGEGEFDVVHDSTRQFSVRAGRAVVVDIGTRFDLRAYAGDRSARVAVSEGAVTLGSSSLPTPAAGTNGQRAEGVLIRPGEVGRLDSLGHATTTRIDNAAEYFGWTDGRLVFEREPLRNVLASIDRWYDVDVGVSDTLVANRLVTAEFSGRSAADMISALAQAVDASVVGSGKTFTIVPR